MNIDDWFDDFMDRHMQRFSQYPWPVGEELAATFKGWRHNFIKRGISEDIAEDVSLAMMAEPAELISFGKMLPRFIEMATVIFKARIAEEKSQTLDDRESARLASLDCKDCGVTGLTHRWQHGDIRRRMADISTLREDGKVESSKGPQVPFTFFCLCALGRWTKAKQAPEMKGRILDLAEYPRLHLRPCGGDVIDNPQRHQWDDWDFANDRLAERDVDAWRADKAERDAKIRPVNARDRFNVVQALAAQRAKTPPAYVATPPTPPAMTPEEVAVDEFMDSLPPY